eukprot:Rhum_TRINITY_DN14932_c29_g1::Rhum_TRINITY_DN14932_c29_g1_i1::g.129847::m.129847
MAYKGGMAAHTPPTAAGMMGVVAQRDPDSHAKGGPAKASADGQRRGGGSVGSVPSSRTSSGVPSPMGAMGMGSAQEGGGVLSANMHAVISPQLLNRRISREQLLNRRLSREQQPNQEARMRQRIKQVSMGKATKGYENYRKAVPLHLRIPRVNLDTPSTSPTTIVMMSKRQFHGELKAWRKYLHQFDDLLGYEDGKEDDKASASGASDSSGGASQQKEGGGGGGGDAAAAAGGEDGGGGGGGGGEDDDDEMCPECNNLMSQPFCGQSGNAHVRKPKAQAGGPPAECFSSDRLCTQCGDGMLGEEARQAQYVCLDCDGKFCEVCWEHEHRNKKRAGHHQLLLFYDCDLCPHAPAGSSHARAPALWFCDTCRLMMCKQCWFNEHKNRHRRPHQQQFLYPGGEQGPFAASTVEAQTLEAPAGTFDPRPYGVFLPGGGGGTRGACTVCNGDNGLPATYHCDECDPSNPEQLCAVCFETEHRMPHRRGHPKKVLLSECAVCVDHEHRPASLFCRTCDLRLCRACHDIEHRNPLRHGHVAEPLHADVLQDPEAARILDAANAAGDAVPSQRTGEIPYAAALGGGGGVFPAAYAVSASPPRILTPGGGGGAAGLAPYGGAGGVGGGSPTYGAGSLSPGITGVSGFENRGPGGGYMSPSRFDSPIYQQRSGSLREDMTTEELQTFMHYRHRLARFYQVYNPAKLPSVVATLREYTGYEEDLMAALARRYGPEPVGAESPLPVGWRLVESTRGDLFFLNGDGRKQWQRPVA